MKSKMLRGKERLLKMGLKKWVLVPNDNYLHKVYGKLTITSVVAGKVCFLVHDPADEEPEKCVLEKQFRKGILIQTKEAEAEFGATEEQEERPRIKILKCKDGTRIRLILKRVVNITPGFYEDEDNGW